MHVICSVYGGFDMDHPYREMQLADGRVARLFESTTDDAELGWHRDREDRIVEVVVANGWSFQRDDELPVLMQEGDVIGIPALEWHRVIRGWGPLVVAVEKLPLQEGKRRVRRSYLRGTRKSNREMRREIDKCAKEPRPKSCYEDWTADKTYRKSRKGKRNPHVKSEGLLVGEAERIIEEGIVPVDEVVAEAVLLMAEAKLSEKVRKALKNKAEKFNAPLGALTAVYRKGLAAWLTGHRQGVSQHQWSMGRVNSFLKGGKARKVDKAQWAMVQRHRSK